MSLTAQAGGSEDAASYADAGQRAMAAGQYAEAQANFEKLATLEPKIAEVHATLAVVDFKLRDYRKAVDEIQTAKKLKPALPKLDSLLGLSQAELGRYAEALPGLEKGFKQTADSEIRRMCGLELMRTFTGLHRDSDAVETALALNKIYPEDAEILYQTGRIYGNFAYLVMEKLHDEARGSIWMVQAQGEAYESQKDYAAAIVAFERVLELDPHRLGIHYRLGRVYLERFRAAQNDKDRQAAQEQFRAELALSPHNGNAAYELAQMDNDQGKLPEAQQEFETLLVDHPDFEQARVGLAGILLENGRDAQAIPLLKSAIDLDPNDEVAWYRMARALRATGDDAGQQKAMAEFRRLHAIELAHTAPVGATNPEDDITPQKLGAETQP